MNYVFDIDGTLTPSRGRIDPEFGIFFATFCKNNPVYLVTGSDYAKTEEQLGALVCLVEGVYSCSGNMLTRYDVEVYRKEFKLPEAVRMTLNHEYMKSGFSVRTGNHIEYRPGTVNFSVVGRNANKWERQAYIDWDIATNERAEICKRMSNLFSDIEFVIGGETGIDIYPKGCDKSQIVKDVCPFTFFGDRCEVGGNDHTIYLEADQAHWVRSWQDTYDILRRLNEKEDQAL